MKLIKLFEDHNKYYWKVTSDRLTTYHYDPDTGVGDYIPDYPKYPFTKKEKEILLPLLNINIILKFIDKSLGSDIYNIIGFNGKMSISKTDDEYYIIKYKDITNANTYYVCDQLDGVLKWVEDFKMK